MTDVTQALARSTSPARARARSWRRSPTSTARPRRSPTWTPSARRVAGVPCLIMRIGFVGEVGYEIHFPAAHGEYLWDALLEAGAEHGLRPFGLEPQRLLRLQKMHILVGQDTDSESTPVRRRDAVDRQARQGGGLHRPLGARALRRAGARDRARRLHDGRRPRADRGRRGARPRRRPRRPRHELALLAAARARSSGWRGCPPRSPPTAPRSRSPTATGATRRRGRHAGRSTTPRARCCARELRVPGASTRRSAERAFAPLARSPMERAARAAGARFEVRDGWNVAWLRVVEQEREAARTSPAGPTSRTSASSSCRPRRRPRGDRRAAPAARARARARHRAPASAWWCPLTRGRALVICAVRRRPRPCASGSRRPPRRRRPCGRGHDDVRGADDRRAAGARGLRPLLRARPAPAR